MEKILHHLWCPKLFFYGAKKWFSGIVVGAGFFSIFNIATLSLFQGKWIQYALGTSPYSMISRRETWWFNQLDQDLSGVHPFQDAKSCKTNTFTFRLWIRKFKGCFLKNQDWIHMESHFFLAYPPINLESLKAFGLVLGEGRHRPHRPEKRRK